MSEKDIAMNFLQLVVAGKIDEAYEKYIDMNGEHHNVYFSAGFSALIHAMKENHKQFPDKEFEIKNIITEDSMVATHSHITLGEKQIAVVHLFRIENVKIKEIWDVGQEIPNEQPNKDNAL